MPELCFITTCMGRLAHLRQTLGLIANQPGTSCILVDYSCPDGCGDWAKTEWPQVKVVRITGELQFHLTRARNAGARATDAPWLFFIDADVSVSPMSTAVVTPLLVPGRYYRPAPRSKEMSGTVICSHADFDRVGGYDEVIQGWGEEDMDLYARFELLGLEGSGFPNDLLRLIPHEDELRVKFYGTKRKELSQVVNNLYMNAKLDLMKVSGQSLTAIERQELYRRVSSQVGEVMSGMGHGGELKLKFARQDFDTGISAVSYLTYEYKNRTQDSFGSG